MNPVCWKSDRGQAESGLGWTLAETDGYLASRGTTLLLRLCPEEAASVNGLQVVGGLQVVETGDLVYIRRPSVDDLSFVVGAGQLVREPAEGRSCNFTGLPIHGESIRCRCGAVYCDDVLQQFSHCPNCGDGFRIDAEFRPAEELL